MPLFFFPCRDHGERGARATTRNFAICALFAFWGHSHICESTNGSHGEKIGARTASATTTNTATPRTAHFFGASRRFLGSVVLSAGCNGSNALKAIFNGFTAHGLKAQNCSRARHDLGTPSEAWRDLGRLTESGAGQELQLRTHRGKSPDAHAR